MRLTDLLTEDLLTEGRKEDAIAAFRKWKSPYYESHHEHLGDPEYPFAEGGLEIPPFVDVVFELDPSGNHKYAKWVIENGIMPYTANAPFNQFIDRAHEGTFDIQYSGNEQYANGKVSYFMKLVTRFDNYLKKNRLTNHFFKKHIQDRFPNTPENIVANPGDINNYDMDMLETTMSRIEMAEEAIKAQKALKTEADDVFTGKYIRVKKPKTHQASCFLGMNTRWCVTTKNDKSHWKRYTKDGDLFFFDLSAVNPSTRGRWGKVAYLHKYKDPEGGTWWDAEDSNFGVGDGLALWHTIRSGIKKEAGLSDEESYEVVDEMKQAFTEIWREHLDAEKVEKYGHKNIIYKTERNHRVLMNKFKEAVNATFVDRTIRPENFGVTFRKMSGGNGSAQDDGTFKWGLTLVDQEDLTKDITPAQAKMIYEYIKKEVSTMPNGSTLLKYLRGYEHYGQTIVFILDTPVSLSMVNEGLSFMDILSEEKKEEEVIVEDKLSLSGIILTEGRKEDAYRKWVVDYWDEIEKKGMQAKDVVATGKAYTEKAYESLVDRDEHWGGKHKFLDWGLKQFAYNNFSIMDIKHAISQFIKYENRITNAIKDSERPDGLAEKTWERIKNNPVDINSYYSVGSLNKVLKIAKNYLSKAELKKIIKDEANVIYQDERFTIVEPKSHRASCHFGRGTKWCTTERGSDNYFNRYTSGDQTLFYIIDKSKKMFDPETKEGDRLSKVAMHIGDIGQITFYDAPDQVMKRSEIFNDETGLLEKVPLFKDLFTSGLYEIMNNSRVTGKPLEDIIPANIEMRENIDTVEGDDIYFNFGKLEEFNKFMNFGDDEYVARTVENFLSPYYPSESFDHHMFDDEWYEGYILKNFSDASKRALKEYLEVVTPDLVPLLEKGEWAELSDEILKHQIFHDFYDRVKDDYVAEYNEAMDRGMSEWLSNQLENELLSPYGFEYEGTSNQGGAIDYIYKISKEDLLKLYEEYDAENLPMAGLMNRVSDDNSNWFDEYVLNDMLYDKMDWDGFNIQFNGFVTKYLEDMYIDPDMSDRHIAIMKGWKDLEKNGITRDTKFDTADGDSVVVRKYDPERKEFEVDFYEAAPEGGYKGLVKKYMTLGYLVQLKTQKELPFDKEEETEEGQIEELGDSYVGTDEHEQFNLAYLKVARVIETAETIGQLKVARKMLEQLQQKYPKMEKTSRDYRFLSSTIINKMDKLKDVVETYEADTTVKRIAESIGGKLIVGREDHVYDLWVDEGVRKGKKKNFSLTIDESGVMSYETLMEETIVGHVAEGSKTLTKKVIDLLLEKKSSLLTEGRIEDAKKKFPEVFEAGSTGDILINNDPSGSQKYLMWMAKMLSKVVDKNSSGVNAAALVYWVKEFHQEVERGLIKNKDINSYKDLQVFVDVVQEAKGKMSKSEKKKMIKSDGAEKIYDKGGVQIYVPKTKEASCLLAKETKRCTAATKGQNYFDRYARHGFLFYIFSPAGDGKTKKTALSLRQRNHMRPNKWHREYFDALDRSMGSDGFKLSPEEDAAILNYLKTQAPKKIAVKDKKIELAKEASEAEHEPGAFTVVDVNVQDSPSQPYTNVELTLEDENGEVFTEMVMVMTKDEKKEYAEQWVDEDIQHNQGELAFGYDDDWLMKAYKKGWFDYDEFKGSDDFEGNLYDYDGDFLPGDDSLEGIFEFLTNDVSTDVLIDYMDLDKVYQHFADNIEDTFPTEIQEITDGENFAIVVTDAYY